MSQGTETERDRRERTAEGIARAISLLEQTFLALAELGIDALPSRTLKMAGEELALEAMRAALRAGILTVPALQLSMQWTYLEHRRGLTELAEHLQGLRIECSDVAASARARIPG